MFELNLIANGFSFPGFNAMATGVSPVTVSNCRNHFFPSFICSMLGEGLKGAAYQPACGRFWLVNSLAGSRRIAHMNKTSNLDAQIAPISHLSLVRKHVPFSVR